MTQTLEEAPARVNGDSQTPGMMRWRGAELVVTHDDSQFANLLDTAKFTHVFKLAEIFAGSQLVPEHFRGKPFDCFIGIQMAIRLGVDPFMFLQNTYVVHGKPGMEAKLAIALINTSGYFTDSLDYEIVGDDASKPDYKVRAFATRKSTKKVIYGPWVDWKIVRAEGWEGKAGSKWKTIPALMFMYRAATWFGRAHCSERLMGMQTVDEIIDVGVQRIDSIEVIDAPKRGAANLAEKIRTASPQPSSPQPPAEGSADQTQGTAPGSALEGEPLQEAEQQPDREPESPGKEEEKAPADDIESLYSDGGDKAKSALYLLAKTKNPKMSKAEFEGGLFKFAQGLGAGVSVADLAPTSWANLHRAIDAGKFDFKSGVVAK